MPNSSWIYRSKILYIFMFMPDIYSANVICKCRSNHQEMQCKKSLLKILKWRPTTLLPLNSITGVFLSFQNCHSVEYLWTATSLFWKVYRSRHDINWLICKLSNFLHKAKNKTKKWIVSVLHRSHTFLFHSFIHSFIQSLCFLGILALQKIKKW